MFFVFFFSYELAQEPGEHEKMCTSKRIDKTRVWERMSVCVRVKAGVSRNIIVNFFWRKYKLDSDNEPTTITRTASPSVILNKSDTFSFNNKQNITQIIIPSILLILVRNLSPEHGTFSNLFLFVSFSIKVIFYVMFI